MSDLSSLATSLPSTRRVLVLSAHFHFDEMATFSRRHPPKPLPIREEPHNLVPTRSDLGRHVDGAKRRLYGAVPRPINHNPSASRTAPIGHLGGQVV